MGNVRSSKAKGRRLQNLVRDKLREVLNSFECKNQERLQVWKSLQQAEENSEDRTPVLVIKRNRSNTYAIIPFEKLMELIDD
jgi:hypothetical protein